MTQTIDYKMESQIKTDLKDFVQAIAVFILFTGTSIYINTGENAVDTLSNVIQFVGGPFLMSSLSQIPFNNLRKSIRPFTSMLINDPYIKILKFYNNVNKIIISDSVKPKINKYNELLIKYRSMMLKDDSYKSEYKFDPDEVIELIDYIITITSENGINKTDKQILQNMISKIDIILDNYKISEQLRDYVLKPIIGNFYTDSHNKMPFCPIYLFGAPGTGKTRFVELLAKELVVPILKFSKDNKPIINEYHEETVETDYKISFNKRLVSSMAHVVYTYKKQKKPMGIFFIDELDKIVFEHTGRNRDYSNIGTYLLHILNPGNTFINDSYIDISVDIRDVLIIATVNKQLSKVDNVFKPLEDRFISIQFPNVPSNLKKKIAINHAINVCFKRKLSKEEMKEVIYLSQKDKSEGVRKLLKSIQMYSTDVIHNQIFSSTSWNDLKRKINQDSKESKKIKLVQN